jgi:hypothetical protein
VTTLQIPARWRDDANWQRLTAEEIVILFGLATRFSPDISMELHICIHDSESQIGTTGANKFFNVTDTPVAAIVTTQAVIAGEWVSVTGVKFFTTDWFRRN